LRSRRGPGARDGLGVETVVDEDLDGNAEVYIEAGDHEALLRMSGEQFTMLARAAAHGRISRPLAR
jgi:Ala-tRNA(Pro) deacylase